MLFFFLKKNSFSNWLKKMNERKKKQPKQTKIILNVMRRFWFTAFGHFIDFVCFPCQNYLRSRHCCSNCCLQIFGALKVVHCRCTACLDLYFRYHDRLMIVSLLCCSLPLCMVMLIFSVSHYPDSPLLILIFFCFFLFLFIFRSSQAHRCRFQMSIKFR